jgi:hypothetical protein
MKMDIDSIVVIIVSILFLIISGLAKRRKSKPAAIKSSLQSKQTSNQRFTGKGLLNDTVTMISDPFDRLEKMFNIPEQTYNQEIEFTEVTAEREPELTEVVTDTKARSQEIPVEKEYQSLEVIVDEVAEYLKDKDISKTAGEMGKQFDEMDLTRQEKRTDDKQERKPKVKISLFENFDDFKKAVIYSEILNRKEY